MTQPDRSEALWGAEIGSFIREAGYFRPTALQQEVIPLILKGKDLAVEAGEGTGKTAAFILPVLLKTRSGRPGIKAIVLTSSIDQVRKVANEFRRFAGSRKKIPEFFSLGMETDSRKEARRIQEKPDILIGTPEKVIDHLRRGSVEFPHLQMVVIDRPAGDQAPEFDNDVRFIFSKLPPRKQTVLFSPTLEERTAGVFSLLRRPLTIPAQQWKQDAEPIEHLFLEAGGEDKLGLLQDLILAREPGSLLILTVTPRAAERLARELRLQGIEAHPLHAQLSQDRLQKIHQDAAAGRISVVTSTFQEAPRHRLRWVTDVVHYDLPQPPLPYGPEGFVTLDSPVLKCVRTMGSESEFEKIMKPQERNQVEIRKEEHPSEEEVIAGAIRRIVEKVREEDPRELGFTLRQIRRNVPLFLRPYFMAHLFRSTLPPAREKKEKFTRLFVSIGKSRRVFSQDLIELFMGQLQLQKPQIGEVKVLENYSFVEVAAGQAKDAISKLSGMEFKGRRIVVNLARRREESSSRSGGHGDGGPRPPQRREGGPRSGGRNRAPAHREEKPTS